MELIKEPKDYEELVEMTIQHLQYCGDGSCVDDNCAQCRFMDKKPLCVDALMRLAVEVIVEMRKNIFMLVEENKSLQLKKS